VQCCDIRLWRKRRSSIRRARDLAQSSPLCGATAGLRFQRKKSRNQASRPATLSTPQTPSVNCARGRNAVPGSEIENRKKLRLVRQPLSSRLLSIINAASRQNKSPPPPPVLVCDPYLHIWTRSTSLPQLHLPPNINHGERRIRCESRSRPKSAIDESILTSLVRSSFSRVRTAPHRLCLAPLS
jgi:hypothetical protein